MSEPERRSSWTFLLVGFILLVVIVSVVIVFAPVAACPDCLGTGKVDHLTDKWGDGYRTCFYCKGKARMTLLDKWKWERELDYEIRSRR